MSKVEPERNRASNSEGLSLFDDIESMKQDLKDLEGSLQEESKNHDQDIRELSERTQGLEVKPNIKMVIIHSTVSS